MILDFHEFMKEIGTSERHQNNNLKTIIAFTNYIDSKFLTFIDNKEDVLSFLETKIKNKDEDPD